MITNKKQQCIVMLTVHAKLLPFITYKTKPISKGEKLPAGVIIRCEDKGRMDN